MERGEIIKEVKNWARDHDGRTPSAKILKEELQIPKWDWIPYWTKITDLQREAGLTPQGFDKTKYTEQDLCEKFVDLIIEKKKWPTRDDLDNKHRKDFCFPASSTFYNKLGLSKDLARKITEHIKKMHGDRNVVKICDSALEKYEEDEKTEIGNLTKNVSGYVYLLKSSLRNSDAYKIGKTKDIAQRLKQLHQASNVEELVHKIKTDDIDGVEKYWLGRYNDKRLYPDKTKDEWFKLKSTDIKAFKRWRRIF